MKVKVKYIRALLEELADRCGETLDSAGFMQMADEVTTRNIEISGRYLREQLYDRLQKGEKEKSQDMEVMLKKPDVIAAYLGYGTFLNFTKAVETPVPTSLVNCIGNWYSYVRVNSGNPELLAAPVTVRRENNNIMVELTGSERLFAGKMILRAGNAVAQLDSVGGKSLTMILKTGVTARPEVLMGVFAGISSGGDPICGREVWVRFGGRRDEMRWKRINMAEVQKEGVHDERLLTYFTDYDRNCIKVAGMSQFDLNDLLIK